MVRIENINNSPLCKSLDFLNQPLLVKVSKVVEHPIHFHQYLEIVLVVKGSINVKSCYKKFTLDTGGFIIINPYEIHSIQRASDETAIACIHFQHAIYDAEESTLLWDPDMLKNDAAAYEKIRQNIIRIVELCSTEKETPADAVSYARNICAVLKSNFKRAMYTCSGEKSVHEGNQMNYERLDDMSDYLYSKYDEKLSLGDVADEFNVSKYYLAHFIKEGLGMSFKSLLNLVRADRSELAVLEGEAPIGDIGYNMGFSSPQYFARCFKLYFNLTPSQYRRTYEKETIRFKEFDEGTYRLHPGELDFPSGEGKKKDCGGKIVIDLQNQNYQLSVLKDNQGSTQLDSRIAAEDGVIFLDFDCDEMIVIIKRK